MSFSKINNRLLNTPTPLKNVPIRIYIPSSPNDATDATPGSFKVVQTLVPPRLLSSKLFPSVFIHGPHPLLTVCIPLPPREYLKETDVRRGKHEKGLRRP